MTQNSIWYEVFFKMNWHYCLPTTDIIVKYDTSSFFNLKDDVLGKVKNRYFKINPSNVSVYPNLLFTIML